MYFFNFMILPLVPSNAPQAVTVSATSSKSIFVSWDPVIADDRNGIIKGYVVNYQALPNASVFFVLLSSATFCDYIATLFNSCELCKSVPPKPFLERGQSGQSRARRMGSSCPPG